MICHEVAPTIKGFLEDLIPEEVRFEIREHLRACEKCRSISHSFNFLAGDLRKIAEIPLEAGLKKNILEALSQDQEMVLPGPSTLERHSWMGIVLGVTLILGIVAGFIYLSRLSPPQTAIKTANIPVAAEPPAALKAVSSPSKIQKLPVISGKRAIFLRPLHWDFYFESVADREAAREKMKKSGAEILFDDSGLLVLTARSAAFENVLIALEESNAALKGGGNVRSIHLPMAETDLRVSLVLNAPISRVSQALSHHWHIQFQLPNRFRLKENIQESGAKLVYESPELWVIEVPGPDLERLKTVVRDTHGVSLNLLEDVPSTENYKNILIRVSLYIEEG